MRDKEIYRIMYFLTTVCPRSSDPFYIVCYYIIWVTTSWTYCTITNLWLVPKLDFLSSATPIFLVKSVRKALATANRSGSSPSFRVSWNWYFPYYNYSTNLLNMWPSTLLNDLIKITLNIMLQIILRSNAS